MMNLNGDKMAPEEKERRMHEARALLRFCAKTHTHQITGGRYYLHEHPASAKSWHEPETKALTKQ